MGAHVLENAAVAMKARAVPAESDAPPDARTWLRGRLLELHELPWPSFVVFWFWCRVLHQPLPNFYDLRSSHGSRERARAKCRDSLDYIVALPYEGSLGAKVAESPTFCRPLWEGHTERDREHSELYPEDLTSHFSAVNLALFRQLVYEFETQKGLRARLH
jgi:hypothetical protein